MNIAKVDLQLIRKSVLRSQLLALESQAQAIYYLTTEHRGGIDLGSNPEIYLIVQHVKDVADSAKIIVDQAKKLKAEEMLDKLQSLQTLANSVVERTEKAYLRIQSDAGERLRQHLEDNLDQGASANVLPQLPIDVKHFKASAGIACHQAELDQHETFKIQVRAICDLALELCFTAASEAGHEYPSDNNYWQIQ